MASLRGALRHKKSLRYAHAELSPRISSGGCWFFTINHMDRLQLCAANTSTRYDACSRKAS
jgi:hypothetical protein